MYETLDRSEGRVLGYEVRDEITEDEMIEILEEMEVVIHEEGAVRLLVYMPTFPFPDLDALDEDIGFWLHHGDDLERYAVVGSGNLLDWVIQIEDRLVDVDIRYFDEGELEEAWAWLEESNAD